MAPNGKNFYVHGDLLTQHSTVLAVDVDGRMREAETHVILIKDIDGDLDDETVMRFIEFAYRGDYTVPPPDVILSSRDVVPTPSSKKVETHHSVVNEPASANDGLCRVDHMPEEVKEEAAMPPTDDYTWGYESSLSTKKKGKKKASQNHWYDEPMAEPAPAEEPDVYPPRSPPKVSKRDKLWSQFCAHALVKKGVTWEPPSNPDPYEDYARLFVCHARLYVFSNRYECDALRDLCLQKLRLTLSRFVLHQRRCPDITHLVRYSYHHTNAFKQGSDKLRSLVSDYVVCHIEKMCAEADFLDLLQECDGLAKDLMVKITKRLD